VKVTTENLIRKRVEDIDIGDGEDYTIELTASINSGDYRALLGQSDIEFRLSRRVWEEDGDAESGPRMSCHWVTVDEVDTPDVPLIWQAFTSPASCAPRLVEELVRHGRAYWLHCREQEARA
jgi:hypothetical protein